MNVKNHNAFTSTQSSKNQNWKTNKYSILTVIEPGPPMLEPSARILKFYAPTESEHKFLKTGIKNWLPIRFNVGSFWLRTRSHNHYTIFNRQWGGFIYTMSWNNTFISIMSWNNTGDFSLLWNYTSFLKSHTYHPE